MSVVPALAWCLGPHSSVSSGSVVCTVLDGARPVLEGPPEGVRPRQSDDVLVRHAVVLAEDVAEVLKRPAIRDESAKRENTSN